LELDSADENTNGVTGTTEPDRVNCTALSAAGIRV
jgi:hypothetical protein